MLHTYTGQMLIGESFQNGVRILLFVKHIHAIYTHFATHIHDMYHTDWSNALHVCTFWYEYTCCMYTHFDTHIHAACMYILLRIYMLHVCTFWHTFTCCMYVYFDTHIHAACIHILVHIHDTDRSNARRTAQESCCLFDWS